MRPVWIMVVCKERSGGEEGAGWAGGECYVTKIVPFVEILFESLLLICLLNCYNIRQQTGAGPW